MTSIIKVNTIQDVGGNNLLISNGSGSITTNNIGGQNTPTVLGYQSSDQSLTKATNNKIVNWTTTVDTDSAFTNNEFTVPANEAGKYWFNWRLKVSGIDDNEYHVSALYKNGSILASTGQKDYANGSDQQVITTGSVMLELAVGDVISVYGIHNEGAERTMFGGTTDASDASFLEGYKLIGA